MAANLGLAFRVFADIMLSAMLNVEKHTTIIIITTLICYGTWKLVWICSKTGTIANLNSYWTGKNKYLIFGSEYIGKKRGSG